MKEYEDILFDIACQLNRIATALEPKEIKQGPVPQLLLDEINGTGVFSETKNNTGKGHQIFYKNDWQYCFCSIGQNHNETIKEKNNG